MLVRRVAAAPFPHPHRADRPARASAPLVVAPRCPRPAPSWSASVGRRSSPSVTGALSRRACWSTSTPATAASSSSPSTSWISRLRHLLAPRRRRHLAVPRRAHRRAVPARHRSAAELHHDAKALHRLAAAARGRAASACSSPSTCSCSSCSSRSCSCRCTSSSAAGATSDRVYAALKFFLYTMLGSAFMLVGILALVVPPPAGDGRRSPSTSSRWPSDPGARHAAPPAGCSSAFAVAFAVKVPLFPVHTWLPDAHTEAPTAGSVILAGVLLKLGTYGFLRFGLYLFPEAAVDLAPLFLTLGVIGIIYGAIVATMQKDLKRLVAYSSVAHLGFIVLGTFALTTQGLAGRRAPDGQPRPLHRRPLPPRRHDLRAPPHPADRRAGRPPEGRRRCSPACSWS